MHQKIFKHKLTNYIYVHLPQARSENFNRRHCSSNNFFENITSLGNVISSHVRQAWNESADISW